MAVKERPPAALLESFANPLWERVKLANAKRKVTRLCAIVRVAGA